MREHSLPTVMTASDAPRPSNGAQWRLVRRPHGRPTKDDVELTTAAVSAPEAGQVLVRNDAFSLEPYMWGRMTNDGGYIAPFEIGEPMVGHAVGTIIASEATTIDVGATVLHEAGWREFATLNEASVRLLPDSELPSSAWLGVLGLTGFTAYTGLLEVARCKPGEVVFVSAAAGAVGSTVAQIAASMGCHVIASAGDAAKVDYLREELGVLHAFSYRTAPVKASLKEALKDLNTPGVDVYFDNVSGQHLEAALRYMNVGGRIAMCGAISTLTGDASGPRNLLRAIWQRVTLQGFLIGDFEQVRPAFERTMNRWLLEGTVRTVETPFAGIAGAFDGSLAMLDGRTVGNALVRL